MNFLTINKVESPFFFSSSYRFRDGGPGGTIPDLSSGEDHRSDSDSSGPYVDDSL